MVSIGREGDLGGKPLEDAFFLVQDKILIEKLREIERMKETKESLARVSGIHNDDILQKLVELDVRPETLAALRLVPLIEVAWADGTCDKKEKDAVRKAVREVLPKDADIDLAIIDRWLEQRPPANLLAAWSHYIGGLCENLNQDQLAEIKRDFIGHVKSVAEASGGFMGLGSKVSRDEQAMLEKLEKAFCRK